MNFERSYFEPWVKLKNVMILTDATYANLLAINESAKQKSGPRSETRTVQCCPSFVPALEWGVVTLPGDIKDLVLNRIRPDASLGWAPAAW